MERETEARSGLSASPRGGGARRTARRTARRGAAAASATAALLLGGCMALGGSGGAPISLGALGLSGNPPPPVLGVLGTVTERASDDGLFVNGRLIALAPDASVLDPFGAAPRTAIRPGSVVALEAQDRPDGLLAASVRIEHPLVGQITAVDVDARRIEVIGVPVELPGTGRLDGEVGTRVAVEGIWRPDRVVASRLLPRPAKRPDGRVEPDFVAGTVSISADGGPAIGAVPLLLWEEATTPAPGTYLRAFGVAEEAGFRVLRLEGRLFARDQSEAGAVAALSVEGYPLPRATQSDADGAPDPAPTNRRRVAGLGIPLLALALPRTRAVLEGPLEAGVFRPVRALPLPDPLGPRRILLAGDVPMEMRLGTIALPQLPRSG